MCADEVDERLVYIQVLCVYTVQLQIFVVKNFVKTLKIAWMLFSVIKILCSWLKTSWLQGALPTPTAEQQTVLNFVRKIFAIRCLITKFPKILCHENLELYGTPHKSTGQFPKRRIRQSLSRLEVMWKWAPTGNGRKPRQLIGHEERLQLHRKAAAALHFSSCPINCTQTPSFRISPSLSVVRWSNSSRTYSSLPRTMWGNHIDSLVRRETAATSQGCSCSALL